MQEPLTIKINNKDCLVAKLTQDLQYDFERLMQSYFMDVLRDSKELLNSDEYYELLQNHLFDLKEGRFKIGSKKFYKFINIESKFKLLFYWLVMSNGLMKEEVDKWVDENLVEASTILNTLLTYALDSKKK